MKTRVKHFKKTHWYFGTSTVVGFELTYDFGSPAVTLKLFNLWFCVEFY